MAATIKIKNSSTAGAAPTSSDLVQGELAVNVTDKRLFTENASGTVVELGTNPSVPVTFPDGSASAPSLTNDGDTNTGLFFPAADTIALTTGGSERLRLDSSGNLGLGVTPSAWASPYKAAQVGVAGGLASWGNSSSVFSNNTYNNSGWKYINSSQASMYSQESGGHYWWSATSGTAGNAITFTQAMTLDASGNLALNTTSPTNPANKNFTVNGGSTDAAFVLSVADTRIGQLYAASGSEVRLSAVTSVPLTFRTADTERARIDSSGRLLVGTTSALNSTANLSVFNTSGGSSGGLSIGYGSGAAANRWIYLISANGSLYFESSANAASLNSAGAWTNASDARLKNSITDIKYGLSAVLSAQPRSYKMNDLEGDYIGFVAQELQTVIPEVVSGDPEKQLGVDYGSLVAVAFKAIQEQQAIITQLQADVAALKGQA